MEARMFFSGMKKGMGIFGATIATIINTVLLTFVYVIGVGLTSIIARLSGKRFLETEITGDKTYWKDLKLGRKPIGHYYRQF